MLSQAPGQQEQQAGVGGIVDIKEQLYQRDRKRGGLLLGAVALVQVLYGLLPFLLWAG